MEEEDNSNIEDLQLDEIPLEDMPLLDADLDNLDENEVDDIQKPDLAREKNIESINHWYTEGRKLYLVDNFPLASEKLSAAAELAARVYGEFAPECFNVHLYYGKTLIELARQEFQVVNMKTDEDESSSDESVDDKKKNGKDEKKDDKSDLDDEENASSNNSLDLDDAPETKESTDQSLEPVEPLPDDDEDCTMIQMAWEVLEVARTICGKQEKSPEWELKKADVLVTLGDASILDEKYKQAVEDILEAIDIMKPHLEEYDRRIAEAWYQLGRAHKLADEFDQAVGAFKNAVDVFKKRIAFWETELQNAEESKKPQLKQDLDDVKSLIPDMESQVQDCQESVQSLKLKQQAGIDLRTSPKKSVVGKSEEIEEKPTSDLTFLVRRKRPAEPQNGETSKSKRIEDNLKQQ